MTERVDATLVLGVFGSGDEPDVPRPVRAVDVNSIDVESRVSPPRQTDDVLEKKAFVRPPLGINKDPARPVACVPGVEGVVAPADRRGEAAHETLAFVVVGDDVGEPEVLLNRASGLQLRASVAASRFAPDQIRQ